MGAAVASILVGGGLALGPFSVAVRAPWRLLAAGVILLGLRVFLRSRESDAPGPTVVADARDTLVRAGLTAGIIGAVGVWCVFQVRVCGGIDSYGYVSTAAGLAQGQLVYPQPLLALLPYADPMWSVTPHGWVPAAAAGAIAPAYPLGFPILMAAAILVGGPSAAFYIPLLLAVGILALTWRLARVYGDGIAALAAVLVVAFNPVMTNMAIQPMSDVPAAFWYLLAVTALVVERPRPGLAGLAFGMAVWTRPLTAVLLPALLIVAPRDRRQLAKFILAGVPIALVMAAVQWHLYGSPWRTGYGGTQGLFTTANIARHLAAYTKWLVLAHSPLFVVALLAGAWRGAGRLGLAAVVGLVLGVIPYLFNLQFFDDVDLLRYLLPALVPCLVVATLGVSDLLARFMRPGLRVVTLGVLAGTVAAGSFTFVKGTFAFQLRQQEQKYVQTAGWIAEHAPANGVVLADLHSGALRLYAQRMTLRWPLVPPGKLGPTIRAFQANRLPCLAVADGEREVQNLIERLSREGPDLVAEPVFRVRTVMIYRVYSTRQEPASGTGRGRGALPS